MKRAKRIGCLLVALGLLASAFSACGTEQASSAAPAEPSATETVASEPETNASETAEPEKSEGLEVSAEEEPVEEPAIPEPEPFELPIVEEPETLTLWMRTEPFTIAYPEININNVTFYKEMEARTGVHVDITGVIAFQADEQFNLMVAGGDYTDMIGRFKAFYTAGIDAGIENSIILDLSELMEDYMPNYQYALATNDTFRRDCTTAEGCIGAANTLFDVTEGEQIGPVVRKDWLEEAGLDLPVTYDDYYEALKAFQSQGHEGSMALRWDGINSGSYLLAGFGAAGFYDDTAVAVPFLNIDGKVEFGPIMDGYQEYLKLMNQWYSEGLIYHDFMSLDTSTYPQNLANGTFGMGVVDRGQFTATQLALEATDPNADLVGCKDARKNADEVLHIQYIDHHVADGYSITTCCENVEVAARYLDYLYTEEGSVLAGYGVEGEGLTYDGNGDPQLSDMILNNETYPCTPAMVLYATYGAPGIYDGSRYMAAYDERTRSAVELWGEDEQDWLYPYNAGLTIEESDTYSTIQSDIYTYVKEMTLKFITGAADPETEWDAYVAAIEGMGVDTIIQMKQDALDRYLAR